MGWGCNDILVLPQDLQDFAWSAPMRELAKAVGLSDVGLKKQLRNVGIVIPPQGHWNRVLAGRPVPKTPRVPDRRSGECGRLRVDRRFGDVLAEASPLPSSGPFASAHVPEDLDLLRAQELKAIGRATVPRRLDRVHPGLTEIFKKEARRREKVAQSHWHWDKPKFDTPVDQRRLRLFNAIFLTLARRGHGAQALESDGCLEATATVGHTRVGLEIDLVGQHRSRRVPSRVPTSADLPARTPLALTVGRGGDDQKGVTWQDDADGTLESKVAEIVAGIIVAGEAAFRSGLKADELRQEQWRAFQERQRHERAEARNRERLSHLRESGDLLRQAQDLRALLSRVRRAVAEGALAIDPEEFAAWEQWAAAEADRLDPVLSGQVLKHLRPVRDDAPAGR